MPVNATAMLLKAEQTCTMPSFLHEAEAIINAWTFHKLISVIAAVTTILTLIISSTAICRHLCHYTVPNEQRQIVRILLTPLIFSILSFFSLCFYNAAAYLNPVAQLYEVFAVVAIFLLFLAFVCPDPVEYDSFFGSLERRSNRGSKAKKHSRGSLRWFYHIWIMVFQVLATRLACSIASWSVSASMCPLDPNLKDAKLAIQVIESIFTVVCLMAIIRFYRRLSPQLKEHNSMSKLVMFKLVIFIQIVQGPLFSGLVGGGVLTPTKHISYQDWSVGLPAFCTCCEMFLFSIVFLWPFTAKPYICSELEDAEKLDGRRHAGLGFFAALLHAINIWDVVSGALFLNKLVKMFSKDTCEEDNQQQHEELLNLRTAYREEMPPWRSSTSAGD
ncbi:hypothetical protein LTR36_010801 [Oleoguttula mirabilis]|uniref:Uncharacterized protein n=1 Tax=Oleoguttula mirabilis TaxID=1507867 RepID=A0AAV9JRK1_9PEZI|nr:hypothetical protein LTR36_010801 [Oleoguttula mirabilis]